MQQTLVKSLLTVTSARNQRENALKPSLTSAAVSHVQSLRLNVRKASKSPILYIHYTVKKKSVLNKSKYF